MRVSAEKLKIGMGLKTFFGIHTIVRIEPYIGPFTDRALNILVFSNGSKMTNTKGQLYRLLD